MAAPTITWKKHTSTTNPTGSTITVLSLGTVTAGQWSTNKCVSVYVGTTAVRNLKLWLADSYGVVNGSPVSMGAASKQWDFCYTTQATVGGYPTLFSAKGTGANTLATNFRSAPDNSVGAGVSLGGGSNSSVAANARSNVAWLSIEPHASAYDGEHTQFGYQVGYDFA
jgi:hypothetical protein